MITLELSSPEPTEALLAEREGRALRWATRVKIAYTLFGILMVAMTMLLTGPVSEAKALVCLCAVALGFQIAILVTLKNRSTTARIRLPLAHL